jgi:two-component sensor histidine kinase
MSSLRAGRSSAIGRKWKPSAQFFDKHRSSDVMGSSLDGTGVMLGMTGRTLSSEGNLLMGELSHRINNEFASAICAISLVASHSGSREVKAALHDVTERLHHYAKVHRELQMPEHQTYVDAASYLRTLCNSITRSKLESSNIRLVLAAQPLLMRSDRCWRLGMIANELIANAARHAFDETGGEIWIELWRVGASVECRVSDNGTVPQTVNSGRGLCIVQELVRYLDGRFQQTLGAQGSDSILIFPF